MRLGSLHLTRRRATRAVAGFVVAFLFAGNVPAAAGLCAVKAPDARIKSQQASHHLSTHGADAAADELPAGNPAVDHHCPTDDPSAQTRTVDVPAAQLMPGIASVAVDWSAEALRAPPPDTSGQPSEPQPLYARLQRLRL